MACAATVTAIYVDGTPVEKARAGDVAVVVLDHTPFYAESGGQVGDTGTITTSTGTVTVLDTTAALAGLHRHLGHVTEGEVDKMKADQVKHTELEKHIEETTAALAKHPAAFPDVLVTSSRDGSGMVELRAAMVRLRDERS